MLVPGPFAPRLLIDSSVRWEVSPSQKLGRRTLVMARFFLSFSLWPPFLRCFYSSLLGRIPFSQALCFVEAIGPPFRSLLQSPQFHVARVPPSPAAVGERIHSSGLSCFAPSFLSWDCPVPGLLNKAGSVSIWSGATGLLWEPDCWIPWDILCPTLSRGVGGRQSFLIVGPDCLGVRDDSSSQYVVRLFRL